VFHTGARGERPEPAALEAGVAAWRSEGIRETDFVCGFSGTMSRSRPLGALIEATRRLARRIPIKLVLAGRGDLEARYREEAAGSPEIVFAGWIDAARMAALNEVADVLAAPYSPDYGFSMPTKMFDYMAAGRPILSSCPGEAAELLRREGIGLQFDVDDADGIEVALASLYEDPDRRRRMGERARAIFEERFSLEAIAERFADHIERIGGAGEPAARDAPSPDARRSGWDDR
jgi:glycosyltransferase involved in cell wall biosynthesis